MFCDFPRTLKERREKKLNKFTKFIAAIGICGCFIMPALAADPEEVDYKAFFDATAATITEVDTSDIDSSWVVRNKKEELLFITDVINEVQYVDGYVNLRAVPTIDSEPVDILCPNDTVTRVGESEYGWAIVKVNDEYYFMWNEYLLDEPIPEPEPVKKAVSQSKTASNESYADNTSADYSASYFKRMGVINWGGYRWTWYSSKILPGGGLNIPGRHSNDSGYICDENGYVCLASNDLAKGTVVSTPFGSTGKIYDSGCASGTLDVYVAW